MQANKRIIGITEMTLYTCINITIVVIAIRNHIKDVFSEDRFYTLGVRTGSISGGRRNIGVFKCPWDVR